MKDVVAVQAQVVWDVSNEALDDQGNPDASKLAAGDWTKLMDAGRKVRQVAQTLAQSELGSGAQHWRLTARAFYGQHCLWVPGSFSRDRLPRLCFELRDLGNA